MARVSTLWQCSGPKAARALEQSQEFVPGAREPLLTQHSVTFRRAPPGVYWEPVLRGSRRRYALQVRSSQGSLHHWRSIDPHSDFRGCLKSPDSRQILSSMCSLQLPESWHEACTTFCELGTGRTFQTSSKTRSLSLMSNQISVSSIARG